MFYGLVPKFFDTVAVVCYAFDEAFRMIDSPVVPEFGDITPRLFAFAHAAEITLVHLDLAG